MTEAQLQATVGSLPDFAAPYVDIDTYADGLYATAIQGAAADLGIDPAKVTGLIAVDYINTVVAGINENLDQDHQIPLISADDQASLDRGLAFFQMLKTSPYSSLGSRYFVVKATFLIYAAFRWAQSSGASEAGMGDTQQAWFLQTMGDATQTWKVWANEFTLQQRDVDLSFLTSLPEQFRQKIRLSAEDWDGMPNRRDTLVQALAAIDNTVVVSGDIHAFFAGLPHVEDDLTTHLVEFVGGAVSSASYKTLLYRTAISDPTLAAAGAGDLANAVHLFLTDKNNRPNPHLAFDAVDQHGYAAVVASGDTFEVTFQMIPEDQVSTNLGADLDSHFSSVRFKVNAGSRDLYRDFDGTWKKWSTDQMDWVEA
jgi:alkaline phosphatase D